MAAKLRVPTQRIDRPVTAPLHRAEPGMHFVMECQSDHRWRWRLMDGQRQVFAMGIRSYATKRECRAEIQRLVGLANVPVITSVLAEGCHP